MENIYERCPVLELEGYCLRLVEEKDAKDLLAVYSDKGALPFFNSDNCNGDIFYYQSEERMLQAIQFWRWSYEVKAFVRFVIVDNTQGMVIGTVELFNRVSEDYFNDCGLLRLDVRSDYEQEEPLFSLLSMMTEPMYELFHCSMIATKVPIYAVERTKAIEQAGYIKSEHKLVGHNGQTYGDYWVIHK